LWAHAAQSDDDKREREREKNTSFGTTQRKNGFIYLRSEARELRERKKWKSNHNL
jgi:hypothetical protein